MSLLGAPVPAKSGWQSGENRLSSKIADLFYL